MFSVKKPINSTKSCYKSASKCLLVTLRPWIRPLRPPGPRPASPLSAPPGHSCSVALLQWDDATFWKPGALKMCGKKVKNWFFPRMAATSQIWWSSSKALDSFECGHSHPSCFWASQFRDVLIWMSNANRLVHRMVIQCSQKSWRFNSFRVLLSSIKKKSTQQMCDCVLPEELFLSSFCNNIGVHLCFVMAFLAPITKPPISPAWRTARPPQSSAHWRCADAETSRRRSTSPGAWDGPKYGLCKRIC